VTKKRSKAQRRAAKRRRQVDRTERVRPSAFAEAKKRPWSMQLLLDAGREDGGIDVDQHEAALEIVSCYRAITRVVDYKAPPVLDLALQRRPDDFDNVRVTMTYLAWCTELARHLRLRPATVVAWIEDRADPVEFLSSALDAGGELGFSPASRMSIAVRSTTAGDDSPERARGWHSAH
jgi:hypothetical protein